MRYSIVFAGALALGVSAKPVYVTELAYVTDVVTVTAGQAAPTEAAPTEAAPQIAAVPTSSSWNWWPFGKGTPWNGQGWIAPSAPAAPTPTPAPQPPAPQPPPPAPTTTYAPVPAPSPKPKPAPAYKPPSYSPPKSSGGGGGGGKPSYQDIVLAHHNLHRKNHSVPEVTWDQGLADTAKQLADLCVYEHNIAMNGGGYGQNIAAGAPPERISYVITETFYNSEYMYFENYFGDAQPNMADFAQFGHFTQIVWKDTKKVGCATVNCAGSGKGYHGLANSATEGNAIGETVSPWFTVCNYSPPGNYANEFGSNVPPGDGGAYEGWTWGL